MIFLCCLLLKGHLWPGFAVPSLGQEWTKNPLLELLPDELFIAKSHRDSPLNSHLCGTETRAFCFPTSKQQAPQIDSYAMENSLGPVSWTALVPGLRTDQKRGDILIFDEFFNRNLSSAPPSLNSGPFWEWGELFCPHSQSGTNKVRVDLGWVKVGLWDLKGLFQPKCFPDSEVPPPRNEMNPFKWSKLRLGGWAKANCGNSCPTLVRIFPSQEYFSGMW